MIPAPDYATRLKSRYEALKALRTPYESLWQEVADCIMPRRDPGMGGTISLAKEARIFDTTAGQACATLANGQLAWMSPQETPWFSYSAEAGSNPSDDMTRWLATCTDTIRTKLALSNFYVAVHEMYLDRSAYGTGCLYVDRGKTNFFNCQYWPVGSYVLDENSEGIVDTVVRCFKLTPRQAAEKFGESNLSEKMREALKDGGAKEQEKCEFLHFILPRADAERDRVVDAKGKPGGAFRSDPQNLPIACVYMELAGSHIVMVSGHEEMPVFVTRYLQWGSAGGNLWGWCPSFQALPDVRQLNHIQKMLDALAEKAAFPPVLAPEGLEGEIDPNAGGVTYFSVDLANANMMPKEWMTSGRYDIGKDRVELKQDAINKAFHVDLFQMFAALDKQMTAREVAERSSEKLIQFSPTFARLVTELFNPLLARLFGMALRAGLLGGPDDIPEDAIAEIVDGMADIPTPAVQYSSRIALAMKALPTLALHRSLELMQIMSALAPQVADNLDFDKAFRETSMSDGVPPDWLLREEDVSGIREARAEQAEQQRQMEAAASAAEAASKLGGISNDSIVAGALQQQQGQPPQQ